MSMNINLYAYMECTVFPDNGAESFNQDFIYYFDCVQTPTNVSYHIDDAETNEEKQKRYEEWIMSITEEEFEDTYSPDDFYCQHPIGKERYHKGEEHIEKLNDFIKYYSQKGYNIIWSVS